MIRGKIPFFAPSYFERDVRSLTSWYPICFPGYQLPAQSEPRATKVRSVRLYLFFGPVLQGRAYPNVVMFVKYLFSSLPPACLPFLLPPPSFPPPFLSCSYFELDVHERLRAIRASPTISVQRNRCFFRPASVTCHTPPFFQALL